MNAYDAKQTMHDAVIRMMARGPMTTRALYANDDVWQARVFGIRTADAWLRELVQPEQEPPTANTRWWLRDEFKKTG